eukprot:281856-Prorocentrum_minimum.AAC.1
MPNGQAYHAVNKLMNKRVSSNESLHTALLLISGLEDEAASAYANSLPQEGGVVVEDCVRQAGVVPLKAHHIGPPPELKVRYPTPREPRELGRAIQITVKAVRI